MTDVKYFASDLPQAPTLSGQAGSLITLLDACLVNGYALRAVNSLTVASNVATANISAGHPYQVDQVVLIDGATPAALNGEKRVLSITANTITYAAPGVADGSATGTITAKVAPAGWTKPYAAANKAVYRNQGNALYLRVDDADATFALAQGFAAMTDVDSGAGRFPDASQASAVWWKKSNAASTATREWRLVADDRFFHLFVLWHFGSTYRGGGWYHFGDILSFVPADAFGTAICGYSANPTNNYDANHFLRISHDQLGKYLAKDMAQVASSARMCHGWVSLSDNQNMASRYGPTYPGAVDGGLHVFGPVPVFEWSGGLSGYDTTARLRGQVPGFYQTLHNANMPGTFGTSSSLVGLSGRKILLAPVAFPSGADNGTSVAVDITGPWR